MDETIRTAAISPLRQRLIDDMNMRRFSPATQHSYIRDVGRFATFLGRSPDTATADDVRCFQIEQRDAGVPAPTMNSIVSALRFFFTHTIDRPDLARKLIRVAHPRNLPVVLSRDEVTRLLNATICLKHQGPCRSPMAPACVWPRLQHSRSATSTANACCSGSSVAKVVGIAMLYSRQICGPCCASGGRSGGGNMA